jgi:hypothetical protein
MVYLCENVPFSLRVPHHTLLNNLVLVKFFHCELCPSINVLNEIHLSVRPRSQQCYGEEIVNRCRSGIQAVTSIISAITSNIKVIVLFLFIEYHFGVSPGLYLKLFTKSIPETFGLFENLLEFYFLQSRIFLFNVLFNLAALECCMPSID